MRAPPVCVLAGVRFTIYLLPRHPRHTNERGLRRVLSLPVHALYPHLCCNPPPLSPPPRHTYLPANVKQNVSFYQLEKKYIDDICIF